MRLLIHTKTMALVSDVQVEDTPAPRVGEVLALPHLANMCQGMSEFLVTNVCWVLNGQKLQAEVSAQAANPSAHRLALLQEQHWIAPADQAPTAHQ